MPSHWYVLKHLNVFLITECFYKTLRQFTLLQIIPKKPIFTPTIFRKCFHFRSLQRKAKWKVWELFSALVNVYVTWFAFRLTQKRSCRIASMHNIYLNLCLTFSLCPHEINIFDKQLFAILCGILQILCKPAVTVLPAFPSYQINHGHTLSHQKFQHKPISIPYVYVKSWCIYFP